MLLQRDSLWHSSDVSDVSELAESWRVGPTTCNINNFQNPIVQREPVKRTQVREKTDSPEHQMMFAKHINEN